MLELVNKSVGNAFEYLTCADNWVPFPPGATSGYHGWCGIGTRIYLEDVVILDSFVYDAAADVYRFVCWMNQANYPSWKIKAFTFDPETATLIESFELTGFAVAHAWTEGVFNGGLNGMYAGYFVTPTGPSTSGYGIVNVVLPDGIPQSSMIENYWVNTLTVPDLAMANMGFALCPERNLLTLLNLNTGMTVWDISNRPDGLGTRLYQQPIHESFAWGMAYENTETVWTMLSDTIGGSSSNRQTIVKYNFFRNQIEMVTELQVNGGPDRFGQIAFDTKRKKIGAIRIKANDADGKANNSFEIYAPRPVMTQITVPVNISKISQDEEVTFITHLLGSKAEAGGNKEIEVECAPTAGLIVQPKLLTGASGNAYIKVTPTAAAATETITVSYEETKVTS
jgi:hypothetical protein